MKDEDAIRTVLFCLTHKDMNGKMIHLPMEDIKSFLTLHDIDGYETNQKMTIFIKRMLKDGIIESEIENSEINYFVTEKGEALFNVLWKKALDKKSQNVKQ
jgi:hypothetical protein